MIKPLRENVLLKVVKSAEEKTPGGLFKVDVKENYIHKAEVVAVGPGVLVDGVLHAPEVSVGQVVIFNSMHANEVTVDGVEFKLCHIGHVLGVVEPAVASPVGSLDGSHSG